MDIPIPVKVLECFCVYKKKMNEKVISKVLSEDEKSVGFALHELSERGILVEEKAHYHLNPDFEGACIKLVDIYKAIKLSKGDKKLYEIYLEEFYRQNLR